MGLVAHQALSLVLLQTYPYPQQWPNIILQETETEAHIGTHTFVLLVGMITSSCILHALLQTFQKVC